MQISLNTIYENTERHSVSFGILKGDVEINYLSPFAGMHHCSSPL